jgi:hypothetical protein
MAGISVNFLTELATTDAVEDVENLVEQIEKINKIVLIEHANPTYIEKTDELPLQRQMCSSRWYSLAQTLAASANNEIDSPLLNIRAKKVDGFIKLYNYDGTEYHLMYEVS